MVKFMRKINNKGFTFIETLVTLLVIAILSTVVTTFLMYGYESFNVYGNYTKQQDRMVQAVQLFRKDLEESQSIVVRYTATVVDQVEFTFPGGTVHKWKFEDGALKKCVSQPSEADVYQVAVDGLILTEALSGSYFRYDGSNGGYIVLAVRAAPTNSGKYEGNNVKEPVIVEFPVKYKKCSYVSS